MSAHWNYVYARCSHFSFVISNIKKVWFFYSICSLSCFTTPTMNLCLLYYTDRKWVYECKSCSFWLMMKHLKKIYNLLFYLVFIKMCICSVSGRYYKKELLLQYQKQRNLNKRAKGLSFLIGLCDEEWAVTPQRVCTQQGQGLWLIWPLSYNLLFDF